MSEDKINIRTEKFTPENVSGAARQFCPAGGPADVREFGNGNINETYLVTPGIEGESRFILQRINRRVFLQPELVMRNISIATGHIRERLRNSPPVDARRWETPRVIPAQDGKDFWVSPEGSFWRAISFIEGAVSFDVIRDERHAGEAGYALGMFHSLLSDLPPERLADTLEGFHITPRYLRHYDEVKAKYTAVKSPELNYCMKFVDNRRLLAHVLENAKDKGRLAVRTIHGDPKINNILIDAATGLAVSVIDLDTVKPGLVHYDIGDCLRSGCNPLGEETENWEDVRFDADLCRAVLRGYFSMAGNFLTRDDIGHVFDSIRLIAFELGLRFLTDYLEGNVYFRVSRPEHNLTRALVQFRLTESIESQEGAVRAVIRDAE